MNKIRQNVFPVLAALIWGLAFSAQADCAQNGMEPFTFNALRGGIATVVLFIVTVIFSKGFKNLFTQWKDKKYFTSLMLGGALAGIALFTASNLQQSAFSEETASGKVGFITVFYLMLVPVFGLVIKRKTTWNVWISVAIAMVGMYFLCIKKGTDFSLSKYDLFALLCSAVFAIHILIIDHFTNKVDGVQLSLVQFFWVTLLSTVVMVFLETPTLSVITSSIWQVLYVGVFSSGVAYTLQILAQKDSNPTVVSLLLSLESIFAVIGGAVLLGEVMTVREYIGCFIMFAAVLLAQIPLKKAEKVE